MDTSITDGLHNDYVGGEASAGRIPGAEKATTGHFYEGVFAKGNVMVLDTPWFSY